jgi:carbon storage regulator CsrA
MLVLSRQRDESLMIGDDISVEVVDIRGDKVRLGVTAPKTVSVHRKEVYDAIRKEQAKRGESAPTPIKLESGDAPALIEYNKLPLGPNSEWIQTYTGRAIWPCCPDAKDINAEDIAHALSLKCRFQGHCKYFYSVAQHSVIVSELVPHTYRLHALLHDANEAYLPDVPAPIKDLIQGWRDIEDVLQSCINEKFGVLGLPDAHLYVDDADSIALATERRDLMNPPPYRWNQIEGIEPDKKIIHAWTPERSKIEFLTRLKKWSKVA